MSPEPQAPAPQGPPPPPPAPAVQTKPPTDEQNRASATGGSYANAKGLASEGLTGSALGQNYEANSDTFVLTRTAVSREKTVVDKLVGLLASDKTIDDGVKDGLRAYQTSVGERLSRLSAGPKTGFELLKELRLNSDVKAKLAIGDLATSVRPDRPDGAGELVRVLFQQLSSEPQKMPAAPPPPLSQADRDAAAQRAAEAQKNNATAKTAPSKDDGMLRFRIQGMEQAALWLKDHGYPSAASLYDKDKDPNRVVVGDMAKAKADPKQSLQNVRFNDPASPELIATYKKDLKAYVDKNIPLPDKLHRILEQVGQPLSRDAAVRARDAAYGAGVGPVDALPYPKVSDVAEAYATVLARTAAVQAAGGKYETLKYQPNYWYGLGAYGGYGWGFPGGAFIGGRPPIGIRR